MLTPRQVLTRQALTERTSRPRRKLPSVFAPTSSLYPLPIEVEEEVIERCAQYGDHPHDFVADAVRLHLDALPKHSDRAWPRSEDGCCD